MTTFDERDDAFEAMFAHDEDMKFRAHARRNSLLGLWAGTKLGKDDEAAQAYAKTVVLADFEEEGDDDVFRKIRRDFDDAGVVWSDADLRNVMNDLLVTAAAQIQIEG